MDDPKKVIEELTEEVTRLRAENRSLILAVDAGDRQAEEATGNSARLERALKEETGNFRKQIEQFKSEINQNQKSLLSLIEKNNQATTTSVRTIKEEVAEAVTAVTTLATDVEQRADAAFKKISDLTTKFRNQAAKETAEVIEAAGSQARWALGNLRWFPRLLIGFSVLILLSTAAWCWTAWDFGKLKTDANWAAVYGYRAFSENGGQPAWDAWVKKHPDQQ